MPAGHETDNPLIVTMRPGPHDHRQLRRAGRDRVRRLQPRRRDAARGRRELAAAVRRRVRQPDRAITSRAPPARRSTTGRGSGTFDNTRQFARAHGGPGERTGGPRAARREQPGAGRVVGRGTTLHLLVPERIAPGRARQRARRRCTNGDIIEARARQRASIRAKINGVTVKSVANTTSLTSGSPGFETYLAGADLRRLGGGDAAVVRDQRHDHRGRGRVERCAGDRQRRLQRERHDRRQRRLHDHRRAVRARPRSC